MQLLTGYEKLQTNADCCLCIAWTLPFPYLTVLSCNLGTLNTESNISETQACSISHTTPLESAKLMDACDTGPPP
eukprot:scaffold286159_cov20-Tisochrysis_lutea.AAC.1